MAFTKINMISYVFYYNLLLQCFIGSLMIVYNIDNNSVVSRFANQDIRFYGWLSILYVMVMMPVGMLAAKKFFKVKSMQNLFSNYTNHPTINFISSQDSYIRLPLYFLTILSLSAVVYSYINLKNIPLLGLLSGLNPMSLAELREEAGRAFGGSEFIRQTFAITLTPILTYAAYAYWKLTHSKKDLMWFLVLFVATFAILTCSLSKSPFLNFLIGFLFLAVLMNGKVKIKTLVITFSFVIVILVLVYIYVAGASSIEQLFITHNNQSITWRIILGQISNFYAHLSIFPDSHPHLDLVNASSFLSSIFGVEKIEPAARIVMRHITPEGVAMGQAGNACTLFIGEAWAFWGITGIILTPIYVGFFIQTLYIIFLRAKKTPVFLGLFAYLCYRLGVSKGVFCFIYNPPLIMLLMVVIATISFSKASLLLKVKNKIQKNSSRLILQ